MRVHQVEGGYRIDGDWDGLDPANAFLAHLRGRGFSPATVRAYAFDVTNLALFLGECNLALAVVDAALVFDWINWQGVRPADRSGTKDRSGSAACRPVELVLALSIARSLTRPRRRAQLPTPVGNTSTLVLDSNTPTVISRLLGRAQDAATEGGSAIRRLLGRAHNAWENGSLWVALVIGMGFGGPAPDVALFVLAIIVASGAAIGTQVSAAIAFVVGVLAVVEITLVSHGHASENPSDSATAA